LLISNVGQGAASAATAWLIASLTAGLLMD
jgi:hypothetical protein